jgi:hypothetical protein
MQVRLYQDKPMNDEPASDLGCSVIGNLMGKWQADSNEEPGGVLSGSLGLVMRMLEKLV